MTRKSDDEIFSTITRYVTQLEDQYKKRLNEAYDIIDMQTEDIDCEFDNRGYCKTHKYFTIDFPDRRCPNQRAREWLARNRQYETNI